MNLNLIAISNTDPNKTHLAKSLAEQLNLVWLPNPTDLVAHQYAYILVFTTDYLGLQKTSEKKFAPFYIDFLSAKMRYRSKQAGLRNERLARAIGIKPSETPRIIDATAGLGRDSYILAKLGYQVTMLERSPILYAMLQDALIRAQQDSFAAPFCEKISLIFTDAITWLKQLAAKNYPEVIYLDPMFPERKKSASVKKEMLILQDLLQKDIDTEELFQTAHACATKRVVVKRSRFAEKISAHPPSFSIAGTSSRFDVYLTNSKREL